MTTDDDLTTLGKELTVTTIAGFRLGGQLIEWGRWV